MKLITKKSLTILCLLVFIFQTSFGQKKQKNKIKRHHNISINHQGDNADISKGYWSIDDDEYGTLIQLSSRKGNSYSFGRDLFFISFYPTNEELSNISNSNNFIISRAAGTINFNAENGEFTFEVNNEFESFLNSENIISDTSYDFMKLFLGEIDKNYILNIKALGYQPSIRELGKLGLLNVSIPYINDINKYYKNLDLNMITKFSIHGVSPQYLEGLKDLGYSDMDANMVKKFAVHNVSLKYIEDLNELGYDLEANMIKKFAIHNISTNYISGLSDLGYSNLDANTIKNFAIHDISLSYIESMLNLNLNKPTAKELKKAKIHGVSAKFVERANSAGHDSQDLSDYVKLKIHGI